MRSRINAVTFNFTQSMEEPMNRSAALILTGLLIALSACHSTRDGQQATFASRKSTPADSVASARADAESVIAKAPAQTLSEGADRFGAQAGKQTHEALLDSAGAAQAAERKI